MKSKILNNLTKQLVKEAKLLDELSVGEVNIISILSCVDEIETILEDIVETINKEV
jgi:hypothetical protein